MAQTVGLAPYQFPFQAENFLQVSFEEFAMVLVEPVSPKEYFESYTEGIVNWAERGLLMDLIGDEAESVRGAGLYGDKLRAGSIVEDEM